MPASSKTIMPFKVVTTKMYSRIILNEDLYYGYLV
jgi:hypothetical protein